MSKAIVLRKEHLTNPIQASIKIHADNKGYDVYDLSEADKTKDYDLTILYHNKPIKTYGKKTAWWMCDLRSPEIFLKENFDKIYLCNKEFQRQYEHYFDTKVDWLPQCGDDREMAQTGRWVYSDLLFIGNFMSRYHVNRKEILSVIKNQNLDVTVISGEGYSQDSKYLYNIAPFSLAISLPKKNYTSNRLYTILSSGGFCITNWFPGIEEQFTNFKDLVWFNDPVEVREIVNYYYAHPEKYEQVRYNAYHNYKRNHTAGHRIEYICQHT